MARLPRSGSAIYGIRERTPEIEQLIEHGARLREAAQKLSEAGLPHDPLHLHIPVAAPDEYLTTLAEVVVALGLTLLSTEDEQKIRDDLGSVIGLGVQELMHSPTGNPGGRLQIRDVKKTLRKTAKRLDKLATGRLDPRELSAVEQVIYGNQTGFREYHDSVAANWLIKVLSGAVGEDRAYDMVHDYRGHASEIAAACRKAVDDLESIRGVGGRPYIAGPQSKGARSDGSRDWFGGFVAVLLFIASRDAIPGTVSTNQGTGLPQGRFFKLAVEFEKLLPLAMRSRTEGALGQTSEA